MSVWRDVTSSASYLHDLHLQVFIQRRSDSDGLQHLAEQLLLQDLHADPAHKPVLTQELLIGQRGRKSQNEINKIKFTFNFLKKYKKWAYERLMRGSRTRRVNNRKMFVKLINEKVYMSAAFNKTESLQKTSTEEPHHHHHHHHYHLTSDASPQRNC